MSPPSDVGNETTFGASAATSALFLSVAGCAGWPADPVDWAADSAGRHATTEANAISASPSAPSGRWFDPVIIEITWLVRRIARF